MIYSFYKEAGSIGVLMNIAGPRHLSMGLFYTAISASCRREGGFTHIVNSNAGTDASRISRAAGGRLAEDTLRDWLGAERKRASDIRPNSTFSKNAPRSMYKS